MIIDITMESKKCKTIHTIFLKTLQMKHEIKWSINDIGFIVSFFDIENISKPKFT